MNKRTKTFLLFIAAIMLGLWLGRIVRPVNSQINGELLFESSNPPAANYQVGNFTVFWDNQYGQFSIQHASNSEKFLWQTLPGASFVQAAQGEEMVLDRNGMFTIKDSWSDTCGQQTIDDIRRFTDSAEGIEIKGNLYCQSGAELPYSFLVYTYKDDPDRLEMNLAVDANRAFLTYASTPDEHFFGFGEQFSFVDMKGQRVPIWVTDQGIGRGDQPITLGADLIYDGAGGNRFTTYAPVPFYMTNKMRMMLLLNTGYTAFDLRAPDRVQVEAFGGGIIANLIPGETPESILEEYTLLTGRPDQIPDWVYSGAIIGMQGGTQAVRQTYENLKARGVPVAAFWLQDWVGQRKTSFGSQPWWNWEVDLDLYPGWTNMVNDFRQDNIRILLYINPNLVDVSEKLNAQRNLFQEAQENGYLVKGKDGNPYLVQNTDFKYGMVDLTNPEAVDWLSKVIQVEVIGAGADGWMADLGEGLPYDAVLAQPNDESSPTLHNRWPVLWAAMNRSVVEKSGQDLVFFSRSGFTGSQSQSTFFWEGDQLVSWGRNDGIRSAVTGINSSSLSGFAYNHSDIGGYTTITSQIMTYHRSEELLLRWMEMNAFTLIFRTNVGNQPEANAQFYSNGATMDAFARWAKIYTALFDYRKMLVEEAARTGMPVVRHPFLNFPEDPQTWRISYQEFMLGSDFLVAPVISKGSEEVEVYLPGGDWVHVWSGQEFQGARSIKVDAPLGQPAVFFRQGSIWGQEFIETLSSEGLIP